MPVIPFLRASDLEIHVAEMVLVADDVHQQRPVASLLDQPDRNSGDRIGDRYPGGHQTQGRSADGGHRAGSVRLQDVGNDPHRVGKGVRVGHHGIDAAFSQRPVSDLAPARAADRSAFANREGGEVVIEHELFAVLLKQPIHPLFVALSSQRDGDQRLRLASLEDR